MKITSLAMSRGRSARAGLYIATRQVAERVSSDGKRMSSAGLAVNGSLHGWCAWARLIAECLLLAFGSVSTSPVAVDDGGRCSGGCEARIYEEAEVQPQKILVVDDSKLIHKMFEVLLRQYALVHSLDGLEALQALGNHADIDLILLDINMPRMSGLEFLNQIKANTAFKDIPVVIISTEGKEEDTVRGLEAGAAAYIKKPFGNQELLEVIQRL